MIIIKYFLSNNVYLYTFQDAPHNYHLMIFTFKRRNGFSGETKHFATNLMKMKSSFVDQLYISWKKKKTADRMQERKRNCPYRKIPDQLHRAYNIYQ